MPRVSVVGAGGTVGRVVVKHLLADDESLSVVALLRRANPELAGIDRCEVLEGGLFNVNALESAVSNSDLVVNLAARNPMGIAEDWEAREDFLLLNGLGAGLVAAAAQRHRLPLVHFSTVSVYETAAYREGMQMSEQETMPALDEETLSFHERILAFLTRRLVEDNPPVSHGPLLDEFKRFLASEPCPYSLPVYGASKLIGEALARSISNTVSCIRMSDVYGPGHESRGVVIDHLKALGHLGSLSVDFGPRTDIYFIYIDDVVRLLRLLIDRLLSKGSLVPRVLNFCGERIDSAAMRAHLHEICKERRMQRAIDIAVPVDSMHDRRYSDAAFDHFFPDFGKTGFGRGLRMTVDARSAASDSW